MLSFFAKAQDDSIFEFSGVIYNNDGKELIFANIVNKNRNYGTISNFESFFSLPVKIGDIVKFSYIGHESKMIKITESFFNDEEEKNYIIRLKTKTYTLPTATITPLGTYEQFKQAVVNLIVEDNDKDRAYKNLALIQHQLLVNEEDTRAQLTHSNAYLFNYFTEMATSKGMMTNVLKFTTPVSFSKEKEKLDMNNVKF